MALITWWFVSVNGRRGFKPMTWEQADAMRSHELEYNPRAIVHLSSMTTAADKEMLEC